MKYFENIADMDRKDTQHKLPLGWVVLFLGLTAFLIYYCAAYIPAISGWTQEKEYAESLKK